MVGIVIKVTYKHPLPSFSGHIEQTWIEFAPHSVGVSAKLLFHTVSHCIDNLLPDYFLTTNHENLFDLVVLPRLNKYPSHEIAVVC